MNCVKVVVPVGSKWDITPWCWSSQELHVFAYYCLQLVRWLETDPSAPRKLLLSGPSFTNGGRTADFKEIEALAYLFPGSINPTVARGFALTRIVNG
jgi:hypothetical protein